MSYLELDHVSFVYPNGYKAVDDISMSFEKGEKVAIIGQNGAGKTTTVKLMNGLLKPTEGSIYVDGENTKDQTTATVSKKVGYVFQNPDDQIFQDSIYKEIAFGLRNRNMSQEEMDQKIHRIAQLCGLESFLQEHPYNLSFSKRKFITIAAIVVMDPSVIILDEPTAGQDRQSTELLGKIIDTLIAQHKTVITITHDMEFVVNNFQRVLVMAEKKLRKDGTPKEIFWNFDLLQRSHLKQPYIAQLAYQLGYKDVLSIQDLIEVQNV